MKYLLLIVFFFPCPAMAEIYKWKSPNGDIHYSDKPPENEKFFIFNELKTNVGDTTVQAADTQPKESSPREVADFTRVEDHDLTGIWSITRECGQIISAYDTKKSRYYELARTRGIGSEILVAKTSLKRMSPGVYKVGRNPSAQYRLSANKEFLEFRKSNAKEWGRQYKCHKPYQDVELVEKLGEVYR